MAKKDPWATFADAPEGSKPDPAERKFGEPETPEYVAAYTKKYGRPPDITVDIEGQPQTDFSGFEDVPGEAGPDVRPESFVQGFNDEFNKGFNNVARLAETGLEQIPGYQAASDWFADATGAAPDVAEAEANQQRERSAAPYQGSAAGEFAGGMAVTAPAMMLPGGPMVAGAVSGGMLTEARDPMGVAADVGIGAASGVVGDWVARAIGGVVSPVVNPLVRRLIDEGVPLTPGQIVGQGGVGGRAVKRLEDSVSNLPLIGTAIRSARARGDNALNRAATRRALTPIGEALPDNVETGHAAVAYAGDRLSAAYNDVLPRLSGNLDRAFERRVQAIQNRAALPPEYAPQVQQVMTELSRAFTQTPGATGTFSGRSLRDASDRLDKLAAGWRGNANDPYLRQVGDLAGQLREQLHALARRENPAQAARLRSIDAGYASLVRVERAAASTDDGIFTGRGYKTATRGADRSTRKRASARGQALDQDLSSAAAQVLPSTVGEGGSNAVNGLALMGALGAGAVGGVPGAIGTIGAGTAGSLLYTEPGQRLMQGLLARQTGPGQQYVADLLRRGAPVVGQATAAATPQAIRSISQP